MATTATLYATSASNASRTDGNAGTPPVFSAWSWGGSGPPNSYWVGNWYNFGDFYTVHYRAMQMFDLSTLAGRVAVSASVLFSFDPTYSHGMTINCYTISAMAADPGKSFVGSITGGPSNTVPSATAITIPTGTVQGWISAGTGGILCDHDLGNYIYGGQRQATLLTSTYLSVLHSSTPTTPSAITVPAASAFVGVGYGNATQTISWGGSTDTDAGTALTYEVSLSSAGAGGPWTVIGTTASGVTTLPYNFGNLASTAQARLRVRAYNGYVYSGYQTMSGNFTINNAREGWGAVLI